MQSKRLITALFFTIGTMLLLILFFSRGMAGTPTIKETPLNPYGLVYDLYRAGNGDLWISDFQVNEIWQVNPFSGAYKVYENLASPSDGRLDSNGHLWWSDTFEVHLGHLIPGADQATLWPLPQVGEDGGPLGIAFDDSSNVWVTNFFYPTLYRFTPTSSQLCTYTVPDNGAADYILFYDGYLWMGDTILGRILRFNPANGAFASWQLPPNSFPQGMAFDASGALWWADGSEEVDKGLGALGRIEPQSNQMTIFAVPKTSEDLRDPVAVAIKSGKIWYTDWRGSIGMLDPVVATGDTSTVLPSTANPQTPACEIINGAAVDVTERSGNVVWTNANYILAQDKDGWLIYDLPSGAAPWGVAASGGDVWFNDQGTVGQRAQQLGWMHFSEPVAGFEVDPTKGVAPLTVTFTNTSSGDYATSLWNFGDGQTSAEHDPTHVYTVAGTYTVSLEVRGLGGSDILTRMDYITVTDPEPAKYGVYLPIVHRGLSGSN